MTDAAAATAEPLVVRPRDACRMLSIGLTRLYELLQAGELQSYRSGRSRRISVVSIHAYVDRQIGSNRAGFRPS
jgi:excisionase family DNA binding protein